MQNFNTNQPDISPANNDSLSGVLKTSFQFMMKQLNTMMPAKVIAYDRTTNRAQVQVQINTVSTNYQQIPGVEIASVPVLLLGGGGFMINFPLNTGDLGWLLATDRDISLFLQNYEAAAPGVFLIRNFSSSLFVPDIMKNYTVNSEDANNLVIQNLSGTSKISIGQDEITISAPTVNIIGQENSTINPTSNISINLICKRSIIFSETNEHQCKRLNQHSLRG